MRLWILISLSVCFACANGRPTHNNIINIKETTSQKQLNTDTPVSIGRTAKLAQQKLVATRKLPPFKKSRLHSIAHLVVSLMPLMAMEIIFLSNKCIIISRHAFEFGRNRQVVTIDIESGLLPPFHNINSLQFEPEVHSDLIVNGLDLIDLTIFN